MNILNKRYAIPLLCCVLALLLVSTAFSQETTAGLQGTVKDPSGAVVTGATVGITGTGLIGKKTATTDAGGYFRFANLSPGTYELTVSSPHFRSYRQEAIELSTGRLPTFEVTLQVGATSETVEVTGAAPLVDVTQSKVQTNVTTAEINALPKGRSYQSVIPFAPGARQEPLQSSRTDQGRLNGFQIDGASDAENVYMTEGLNTTAIYGGGVGANVPFEFVQEVQVKSSSFEAEFGGATGGVVNVIQKRGSNAWHGSVFAYYRGDPISANDVCINRMIGTTGGALCGLRLKPGTSLNAGTVGNLWADRKDGTADRYIIKQDKWDTVEPGYEVGGPLIKDRLWLFSSYVPSLSSVTRSVNFTGANAGPHSFTQTSNTHNFMNRLDYRLANSVRLFASWQSGYNRQKGVQTSLNPDSAVAGQVNTSAGTDPNSLRADTGSTNPLTILNFGGDWTIGSKVVVTARYGSFYTDNQDRGRTTGTRYIWQADSTAVDCADPANATFGCTLPASVQHTVGFANIPSNQTLAFDIFKRRQFSGDVAYFVGHFAGTHNFKAGYSMMRQAEDTVNFFNTSQVLIWYTNTDAYTTASGPTSSVCGAVISANGACRGPYGYYMLRDGVLTNGKVSALNHSIYFQDAWTIKSLTINAGVRLDKEFLPPYNAVTNSGISFGFGQKVAPRIGAAYDVLHNGKLKVYGSYGKFFDIMKYSLPRGSFGGDRWHDCVYTLTTTAFTTIVPNNVNLQFCPDSGPASGTLPGTFIENQNWRASATGLASDPVLDPNMHPMSTHEFVFGANWEIKHNLSFESRYARKRVDWTIEDMSLDDGQYYIGNPGSAYSQLLHRALPNAGFNVAVCPTCPNLPKAIRNYDGLEFRLIRRATDKWFGQVSYAYSRLYGNYAGLSDTAWIDGNGGRHEPNNGRAFDLPNMLFDGAGHTVGGPLPTDRPHVVTGVGYYRLKWWGMETLIGATQEIASGSPQSTCLGTVDSASGCQFVAGQGNWINFHQDPTTANIVQDSITKGRRSPALLQTDLSFSHEVKVSKTNEAMRLSFSANVFNLFNQHAAMVLDPQPLASGYTTPTTAAGAPIGWDYLKLMNSFDYLGLMNDRTTQVVTDADTGLPKTVYGGANTNGAPNTLRSRYGLPVIYQGTRNLRLQLKFSF